MCSSCGHVLPPLVARNFIHITLFFLRSFFPGRGVSCCVVTVDARFYSLKALYTLQYKDVHTSIQYKTPKAQTVAGAACYSYCFFCVCVYVCGCVFARAVYFLCIWLPYSSSALCTVCCRIIPRQTKSRRYHTKYIVLCISTPRTV